MRGALALAIFGSWIAAPAFAELHVLVVSGLGGEPEYETRFVQQAKDVAAAATRTTGDESRVVLLTGQDATRERLQSELRTLAERATQSDQVFMVVIGHGSFDGEEYRLNLPGPDITGSELGALLDQLPARQQLVVNTTSASGAVIERWKRPNRVVITATRSGGERNATRFAQYWAEALSSAEADLDKNEAVTAAEAFEYASRKVADAFKADVALATERARLEGESADRFVVARLGGGGILVADAELTAMLTEQAAIEQRLGALRSRKESMDAAQYYDELEQVLVAMAQLDRRISAKQASLSARPARESDASESQ